MVVKFKMPKIKYEYDSLEPYIDKKTMKIHIEKHHQTYLDKFNAEVEKLNIKEKDLDKIILKAKKYSPVIVNMGGGFWNHNFFFEGLEKNVKISGKILKLIDRDFKSFDKFKESFSNEAIKLFGSGWVWLVLTKSNKLKIMTTQNQENPLMFTNNKILLGVDVWEHAYYLKYQNKRPDYINNFFNVINWKIVNKRLNKYIK